MSSPAGTPVSTDNVRLDGWSTVKRRCEAKMEDRQDGICGVPTHRYGYVVHGPDYMLCDEHRRPDVIASLAAFSADPPTPR